jgi:hypothetical protein
VYSADAILQREGEDIIAFLTNLPSSIVDNTNAIIKSALAFKLTPDELHGLPH